ncbi:MAG TPA: DUF5673 domain-containing protein [Planctomycetaceae bacterium]|nr:DUF5673 domain-containing protein [Planctomycetaceae bacterium]
MSRPLSLARIPAFALTLTLLTTRVALSQSFAKADAGDQRPGIVVKNADPEFTLRLPMRYVAIKPTGDALYAFGTTDKTTGGAIAIYRLNRTLEPGTLDASKLTLPDARRIDASWKTFTLDMIAWHQTPDNGPMLAARWLQVPLQHEAISILVFVPVEKEAKVDDIMHDFLSGLDGPSSWPTERPLTAGERGMRLGLGLALLLVLLGGPPIGLWVWQRRLARPSGNAATTNSLRKFGAALATPAPQKSSYWIRVVTLVFVLIALALGYFALMAAGVTLVFNQTFQASFKGVLLIFELACLVPLVIVVGVLIRTRRGRGRVLLDLGPDQMRTFFLVVAIVCLTAAIMGWAGAIMNSSGRTMSVFFLPVMQIVLAAMFIVRGMGRVQITENGLWQNSSLLRWTQIGSYHWIGDSTELTLQGPSPIPTKLSVPPERKQAVQDLLMQRGVPQRSL